MGLRGLIRNMKSDDLGMINGELTRLQPEELSDFRFHGYDIYELIGIIHFAKEHGYGQ